MKLLGFSGLRAFGSRFNFFFGGYRCSPKTQPFHICQTLATIKAKRHMTTKNYFIIPVLLITIGLLTSCSNNNDWNRFGLNGKIKTYLERNYEAEMKFGEWETGDIEYYGHNRVSFDSVGNYQWIEYLNEDNELSRKLIPKRENGDVIEEACYDDDGALIGKSKIIRNSRAELEFTSYGEDGEKNTQGKSYFANNRVIKQHYLLPENRNTVKMEISVQ